MKTVKIVLVTYLLFHIVSVLLVNAAAVSNLKGKEERLNKLGKICVDEANIRSKVEPIKNSLGLYLNLTGVNRGYEFFSPNVANGYMDLVFISDKGKELPLLNSIESDMKELTFNLFFNSVLEDKDKLGEIIKSTCRRLFMQNKNVKGISVYGELKGFKTLKKSNSKNYLKKEKRILLSKVSKS